MVAQEAHAAEPSALAADTRLESCSAAVDRMQAEELDRCLRRAAAGLPRLGLLRSLIAPLLERIGRGWKGGEIGIAHEHLAVSVIKGFLLESLRAVSASPGAPTAVAGTPAGQHCELGALMAAVVAADSGWRVLYLGPDLPMGEIAAAAAKVRADAVLLSMVVEAPDGDLSGGMSRLKRALGARVAVHAGGSGLSACSRQLEQLGITCHDDLNRLSAALNGARSAAGRPVDPGDCRR